MIFERLLEAKGKEATCFLSFLSSLNQNSRLEIASQRNFLLIDKLGADSLFSMPNIEVHAAETS